MIEIGRMRHSLVIEQMTRTPDQMGGFSEDWTPFAISWGEIKPLSANERMFSQKLRGETTHRVRLRYRAGITEQMRVRYTAWNFTRYFQIHGVINEDERNGYTVLLCQEGVNS